MKQKKTFDMKDLDEKFWKKVVFGQLFHSSGMGGPGCIWLVTSDKKKYYLGFEGGVPFSEYHLDEAVPIFARTNQLEDGHYRYKAEDHGWRYVKGENALVREDIWDAYVKVALNREFVEHKVTSGFMNMPDIIGLALGTEHLERYDYIEAAIAQEKWAKEMKRLEEEHERKKLRKEEFMWKPIYSNNIKTNPQIGEYALLLKKEEDGTFSGRKFSIIYQWKQIRPMIMSQDTEVEGYALFWNEYDTIHGPLQYPPCEGEQGRDNIYDTLENGIFKMTFFDWVTFTDSDLENYGRFLRYFQTAEEAKEYAMCFANANALSFGNIETVMKEKQSETEELKSRLKYYEAYQAYYKYYPRILNAISSVNNFPDNGSGGGGYLIEAILKAVPEISREQLKMFWHDVPLVLEKRTQDRLEEQIEVTKAAIEEKWKKKYNF